LQVVGLQCLQQQQDLLSDFAISLLCLSGGQHTACRAVTAIEVQRSVAPQPWHLATHAAAHPPPFINVNKANPTPDTSAALLPAALLLLLLRRWCAQAAAGC
jgi:hypothetical protein